MGIVPPISGREIKGKFTPLGREGVFIDEHYRLDLTRPRMHRKQMKFSMKRCSTQTLSTRKQRRKS